jgi:diguanylate cyclase (GGDEF)-like protein
MIRVLLTLAACLGAVAALCAPAAASSRDYVLIAPGTPAIVVGPRNAEQMSLVTPRGTLRSGRFSAMGAAPLGHAATEFPLPDGLAAGTPVHVTIEPADAGAPYLVLRQRDYDDAIGDNRKDGIVIGILLAMMFVQLVGFVLARDASMPWYMVLLGSLAVVMLASDGALPLMNASNGQAVQVLINLANGIALIGFEITYLRLWTGARPLVWRMLTLLLPLLVVAIVIIFTPALHAQANLIRAPLAAVFTAVLIGIAIVRVRTYPPARYLIGAIALLSESTIYRAVRTANPRFGNPFLDHWNFQISTALDALVFGLAVAARVRYSLRERRQLQRSVLLATHEARHDALTGVLNRRGLFASVAESDPRGTLFFIDLDGFKAVNDRLGHAAGDTLLAEAANVLKRVGGSSALVARIGGDEFIVIVPPNDNRSPDAIGARIVDEIERLAPFAALPDERFGASIGVVPLGELTFENALRLADQACYREKHRKNRSRMSC